MRPLLRVYKLLGVSSQVRLTFWAALCVLTAPLLYGICWLDTALAGENHIGTGRFPYAQADAVRYGLGGLRYLYRGHTLTGPHIGYPLVLGVLVFNTLGLGLSLGWGKQARRMMRVSLAALLLTLGGGWPMLELAQQKHNHLLAGAAPTGFPLATVDAGPVLLRAERCTGGPPCTVSENYTFPNPTAWGLAGLLLTGAAGLSRRPAKKTPTTGGRGEATPPLSPSRGARRYSGWPSKD